ncbi:MAG: putative Ig domain-containing protein [Gammaproteobacteria bacterium]
MFRRLHMAVVLFVAALGIAACGGDSSSGNLNLAPVLAPIGTQSATVGETLSFTVSASDPNGADTPSLTASGLPSGAEFTDNGDGTGAFRWTPDAGAEGSSPYSVEFTATDGRLSDSETVQINVGLVGSNQPPQLTPIGNRSVTVGATLTFSVSASDSDGPAPLTLSTSALPAGATFTDNGGGSGSFSWTPQAGTEDNSPYSITFTATDGDSASDSETVLITVNPDGTALDCGPNGTPIQGAAVPSCQVTGTLTEDFTLTSDVTWVLAGGVFVGVDNTTSVDLTIEPGTRIVGQSGADFLVITRGSRILANGTRENPIVMTSADGDGIGRGEWGGLIINGNAPINGCADGTPLCQAEGEGSTGLYGGNNPNDDSGVLRYVRVEHAGFEITPENELNGIAFQGVGDGTIVEYIQVHLNADDGVEFFGGTVNAKYIVLTGTGDDALDWTQGWQGKVQYVVAKSFEDDGDQGIEADNNGDENTSTPRALPTLSNLTFIGSGNDDIGILLREGTGANIYNAISTGWGEYCVDIDNAETFNFAGTPPDALSGNLTMVNSIMFGCSLGEFSDGETDDPWLVSDWFNAQSGNSVIGPQLVNYIPAATSPALGAGTTPPDPFFDTVDFIGGVRSAAEDWTAGWTVGLTPAATSCPDFAVEVPGSSPLACQISGLYTQDITLSNDIVWVVTGGVFIGEDVGGAVTPDPTAATATLTIEPGTTLIGQSGSDFLVINRGSAINAVGSAAAPIVMTSADGDGVGRGEWGGLIINGRAPINGCADGTLVCEAEGEGSTGLYGGNVPDDSSGALSYVRVEHAGFEITPENELNGIAFQGVGSGTQVDHIQVHLNADDGVEFFGGTVNAKYIVLTGTGDDALDWTQGWTGKVQHVLVKSYADDGDQGIEADNNGDENTSTPRALPTLANLTFLGSGNDDIGILLREGTGANIYNAISTGWGEYCVDIDNAETFNFAGDPGARTGNLTMENSIVSGCSLGNFSDGETDDPWLVSDWYTTQTGNLTTDPLLGGATGLEPLSGSPALVGSDVTPPNEDGFFDTVDYIGGFDPDSNWAAGWTIGLTD